MNKKSDNLQCSVTSLLAFRDFLLVGVGGNVEIYFLEPTRLFKKIPLFKNSSHFVHGFVSGEFETSDNTEKIFVYGGKSVRSLSFDKLSYDFKDDSFHYEAYDWIMDMAFFHSSIYLITAHNKIICLNKDWAKEQTFISDENCILYSSTLVRDQDELVVIGGTVFQQVIVWLAERNIESAKIIHRLVGHEGVIFSLQYNSESDLICSTSDDRSARLWQVVKKQGCWKESEIIPSHVLSRIHSARVFRCIFSAKSSEIFTAGEDSMLAFWNTSTGKLVHTWKKCCDGSPIWSLAAKNTKLYVGGANGCLKGLAYDAESRLCQKIHEIKFQGQIQDDCPKAVQWLADKRLLVLTQNGSLYEWRNSKTSLLFKDPDLQNYALFKCSSKFMYFATIDGRLKWSFTEPNLTAPEFEKVVVSGKVLSLAIMGSKILVCGLGGIMKLFDHVQPSKIKHLHDLELPPAKEQRWFSCAVENYSNLIVGDRSGNIHIYSEGLLIQSIQKVHNKHGVGFIEPTSTLTFLTGGRDGYLKTFTCSDGVQKNFELTLSQHLKVSWLEKYLPPNGNSNDPKVLGFHSSNFVIHSVSEGINLSEVECGGGHRAWDFNGSDFAFIKDRKLMMAYHVNNEEFVTSIKQGLHSLTINCVQHFSFAGNQFLVTGSEDTLIKIIRVTDDGRFRLEQTLRGHISSVRAMHVTNWLDKKVLVSAGGRAELKVWTLSFFEGQLLITEAATCLLKGNDKQRQKSWKEHEMIFDTETRYLSVQIRKKADSEKELEIATACSDGVLRIWQWSYGSKKIHLETESEELHNICLKILWFNDGLVAADTVGNLSFWTLQQDLLLKSEIKALHKNGINAICIGENDKCFTGGDDGNIRVSNLESWKKEYEIDSIGAAHVTGLVLSDKYVISCSIDQRVTWWTMDGEEKLKFQDQKLSHVPDIHDMVIWKNGDQNIITVVGNGIETMSFF